jgi:hypothetical protein
MQLKAWQPHAHSRTHRPAASPLFKVCDSGMEEFDCFWKKETFLLFRMSECSHPSRTRAWSANCPSVLLFCICLWGGTWGDRASAPPRKASATSMASTAAQGAQLWANREEHGLIILPPKTGRSTYPPTVQRLGLCCAALAAPRRSGPILWRRKEKRSMTKDEKRRKRRTCGEEARDCGQPLGSLLLLPLSRAFCSGRTDLCVQGKGCCASRVVDDVCMYVVTKLSGSESVRTRRMETRIGI